MALILPPPPPPARPGRPRRSPLTALPSPSPPPWHRHLRQPAHHRHPAARPRVLTSAAGSSTCRSLRARLHRRIGIASSRRAGWSMTNRPRRFGTSSTSSRDARTTWSRRLLGGDARSTKRTRSCTSTCSGASRTSTAIASRTTAPTSSSSSPRRARARMSAMTAIEDAAKARPALHTEVVTLYQGGRRQPYTYRASRTSASTCTRRRSPWRSTAATMRDKALPALLPRRTFLRIYEDGKAVHPRALPDLERRRRGRARARLRRRPPRPYRAA